MRDLICSYYTTAGVSPTAGGSSPRPFADRVEACARAGYTGVGIHIRDYRAIRAQGHSDADMVAMLRNNGMRHVEVEFLLNWFAEGEAGEQARRDEETFHHMVEVFGARVMFLGGDMTPGAVMPFERLIERFAAVAERARARGVMIGVEPCAWTNIGDIDDALRLIEGSGATNAGLFLDAWHLYRRGLDWARLLRIDPRLIAGVQLDDAAAGPRGALPDDCLDHRLLPGDGDANTEGLVSVLGEIGYAAPFSVEVISIDQRARPLNEAARVTYQASRMVVDRALAGRP